MARDAAGITAIIAGQGTPASHSTNPPVSGNLPLRGVSECSLRARRCTSPDCSRLTSLVPHAVPPCTGHGGPSVPLHPLVPRLSSPCAFPHSLIQLIPQNPPPMPGLLWGALCPPSRTSCSAPPARGSLSERAVVTPLSSSPAAGRIGLGSGPSFCWVRFTCQNFWQPARTGASSIGLRRADAGPGRHRVSQPGSSRPACHPGRVNGTGGRHLCAGSVTALPMRTLQCLSSPFCVPRTMFSILHVSGRLIPTPTHLVDEETEARTGEITFPSYQLVSGRAKFHVPICDQRLAGPPPVFLWGAGTRYSLIQSS